MSAPPLSLEHRRLLTPVERAASFRPFRDTDLFARIGGAGAVARLVDGLYDRIEGDDALRPLFARALVGERARQKQFFTEWLGGERRYSDAAHASLGHRHDGLPITRGLAGRWLAHFRQALEQAVGGAAERAPILAHVQALALAFVNQQEVPPRRHGMNRERGAGAQGVAWCGVDARTLKDAADRAHRGDADGVRAALTRAPDLLRPSYGARLMQAAVLAGRARVVATLLDRGVDRDRPHPLAVGAAGPWFEGVLFVTPLCAARSRSRAEVEALLLEAGAREDLFTAAFVGDLPLVERVLGADGRLAQAADPAADVLDITPVHHAIAGGHLDAVRRLLAHAAGPVLGGARALRAAAGRGDAALVELLLERDCDATRIGVGRWVLDPRLAPLLAARGAALDRSGSWIGAACTGNQGRKDDPEYVRALLRHGARADDRRTDGIESVDATALHHAARAGFVETIAVLLEHGADPAALDREGRTPSDWLERAAPSVDRERVRRLLRRPGARPSGAG